MRSLAHHHVIISDEEYELPYSKGLMASAIMATGLAPARAFHVAEVIEDQLAGSGLPHVSRAELNGLALDVLRAEVGDRWAESFANWQRALRLDVPLVILLGGATGVGKSTIATMLASRLGVTRVIPTDAIREVMRSMVTAELFPTLHTSSYDTGRLVRTPLPRSADPVVIGFREQTAAVSVGVEALIQRAVEEGTDLIVEGAHLVPGFVDLTRFEGGAVVVPMVVTVDDEEAHRSHILKRASEARNRPSERYLDLFGNIRKMQRYIKSLALQHGVAIVPSYNLDATLSHVIELVVSQAIEAAPGQPAAGSPRGAARKPGPAAVAPARTKTPRRADGPVPASRAGLGPRRRKGALTMPGGDQ
jgi:2-phosphoglycerate kinase